MSSDHHVYRVVTAFKTERQYLATEEAGTAAQQRWGGFSTTCRDACGDFIAAGGARVVDAPSDGYGGRWLAAHWLAAICGCAAPAQETKATSFCRCWGSERKHGHSHASCDQSTQSVHLSLSC